MHATMGGAGEQRKMDAGGIGEREGAGGGESMDGYSDKRNMVEVYIDGDARTSSYRRFMIIECRIFL
jgi:hypothetical protein